MGEVAVEGGEEGVEVALGLELAAREVGGGVALLREGDGGVESGGEGVEEVEREWVGGGGGGKLGGEIGEVGLEVGEFDSDE